MEVQKTIEEQVIPKIEYQICQHASIVDSCQKVALDAALKEALILGKHYWKLGRDDQYTMQDYKFFTAQQAKIKATALRVLADTYRHLAELNRGCHLQLSLQIKCMRLYREAEAACCDLSPCDDICLRLAMSQAAFYFEQMRAPEMSLKFTAQAIIHAK